MLRMAKVRCSGTWSGNPRKLEKSLQDGEDRTGAKKPLDVSVSCCYSGAIYFRRGVLGSKLSPEANTSVTSERSSVKAQAELELGQGGRHIWLMGRGSLRVPPAGLPGNGGSIS